MEFKKSEGQVDPNNATPWKTLVQETTNLKNAQINN